MLRTTRDRFGSSRRLRHRALATALAAGLLAGGATAASATSAAPTLRGPGAPSVLSLFPRFSAPRDMLVANATGLSAEDLLTTTTLQGVFNAAQQPGRLYLIQNSEDQFWLSQLPHGIRQVTITPPSGQTLVQALLEQFRPFISGAIVTDPSNTDTVNLATTLAGIDHAVVIAPDQESLAASLGIPVLYSFDTAAFTADTPAQTYQWAVTNLLPQATTKLEVVISGTSAGAIRDYAVATKAFVYWLTSTNSAELPVLNTIIEHDPVNTPVLGYVPNENPDVANLSSQGYFLNGTQTVDNESVWASLPSPTLLRQRTQPAPLAARPGTVYVAFLISDGDNIDYDQQTLPVMWQDQDLGTVPAGWTVAPAMVDLAPPLLEYFYRHLPADSELDAGPSGIGYTSQETGADMTQFSELTRELLAQVGEHTVDTYEPAASLSQYAQDGSPASVSKNGPLTYEQAGKTVIFGQTSGYINSIEPLFCTVDQQASSQQAGGAPVFLEPLVNGFIYSPTDLLQVAQSLAQAAQAEGINLVFTTPTELALTMQRYYAGQQAGLPAANVQSQTGAQVLAQPSAGTPFPTAPVQITGPNLVTNPSGASGTTGWTAAGGTVTATTYQGAPALQWTSDVTSGQSWIHYYPDVTDGDTYTFSADVAGSGQLFIDVYNGSSDEQTLAVNLTSAYQKITWTDTIPASAPGGQTGNAPQLQIREVGAGPVTAYIASASVAQSTAPC